MDQLRQLQIARQVIADFSRSKRDCDNLARKPRIAEIHAISRNIKETRAYATVSINDILDSYAHTAMLQDPAMRETLRRVSDTLNKG